MCPLPRSPELDAFLLPLYLYLTCTLSESLLRLLVKKKTSSETDAAGAAALVLEFLGRDITRGNVIFLIFVHILLS